MTLASLSVFLLATFAAAAGAANTCSLDPITWSCPAQPPLLSLAFAEVTIEACGESYNKELFATLENIKYTGTLDQDKTYTAVMVDPDAPGHDGGKAWLHWIRAGLTSADLTAGTLSTGQDIVSYRPPTPPKNTGVHRYFVFVFEETQTGPQEEIASRGKFDLAAYATSQKLCGPLAANMFQTQH